MNKDEEKFKTLEEEKADALEVAAQENAKAEESQKKSFRVIILLHLQNKEAVDMTNIAYCDRHPEKVVRREDSLVEVLSYFRQRNRSIKLSTLQNAFSGQVASGKLEDMLSYLEKEGFVQAAEKEKGRYYSLTAEGKNCNPVSVENVYSDALCNCS